MGAVIALDPKVFFITVFSMTAFNGMKNGCRQTRVYAFFKAKHHIQYRLSQQSKQIECAGKSFSSFQPWLFSRRCCYISIYNTNKMLQIYKSPDLGSYKAYAFDTKANNRNKNNQRPCFFQRNSQFKISLLILLISQLFE